MTEQELLELAAKAAGLDANLEIDGTFSIWNDKVECTQSIWNPRTNDGDAFRLAVAIAGNGWAFSYLDEATINGSPVWLDSTDPNEATRRAIVLAAAKIGKEMR